MQSHLGKRSLPSPRELDTKLELLQELGYVNRFYLEDDDTHTGNPVFLNEADRWIQTEYNWALEEAAESVAGIPDLFDGQSTTALRDTCSCPDSSTRCSGRR